jgi:hypothetical protein
MVPVFKQKEKRSQLSPTGKVLLNFSHMFKVAPLIGCKWDLLRTLWLEEEDWSSPKNLILTPILKKGEKSR